jgi:hypothetical protein
VTLLLSCPATKALVLSTQGGITTTPFHCRGIIRAGIAMAPTIRMTKSNSEAAYLANVIRHFIEPDFAANPVHIGAAPAAQVFGKIDQMKGPKVFGSATSILLFPIQR